MVLCKFKFTRPRPKFSCKKCAIRSKKRLSSPASSSRLTPFLLSIFTVWVRYVSVSFPFFSNIVTIDYF